MLSPGLSGSKGTCSQVLRVPGLRRGDPQRPVPTSCTLAWVEKECTRSLCLIEMTWSFFSPGALDHSCRLPPCPELVHTEKELKVSGSVFSSRMPLLFQERYVSSAFQLPQLQQRLRCGV